MSKEKPTFLKDLSSTPKNIVFSNRLTVAAFEGELARSFDITSKSKQIIFDLTNIEWIGYLPAKLLFAWAATLIKSGSNVIIKLPPRQSLHPQVKKVLLEYGIIEHLSNLGAEVTYSSSPSPKIGIPHTIIESEENLWDHLQTTLRDLLEAPNLQNTSISLFTDVFNLVIFELLENAFVHAKKALPNYGVNISKSGATKSSYQGWMSVFENNTEYTEIYVGDLGPGIQDKLTKYVPDSYIPPFNTNHRFLKDETILAFAFEFSSTSNKERRKQKIRELLNNEDINEREIATGLYCVLEIVRQYSGQFILRTPKAILSFDFYRTQNRPVIKGKKELGIKTLGRLPGTHFLIRLPLSKPVTYRKEYSLQTFIPQMPVRVIDAFVSQVSGDNEGATVESQIHSAIAAVDSDLFETRIIEGITLILPPRKPLQSRAEAVFIAAIKAMNHGLRRIIWLNRRASLLVQRQNDGALNNRVPESFGNRAILVGELFQNSFMWAGSSDFKLSTLVVDDNDINGRIRLRDEVQSFIRDAYIKYAVEFIRSVLKSDEIKHTGKSFLIEKQYYTETYFEVPRVWDNPFATNMLAELAVSRIDSKTKVIIGHTTTAKWLSEIAVLFREVYDTTLTIIVHERDTSPAEILTKTLSLANQHTVILTDVICTAERIKNLLSSIISVEIDKILTLIDGRAADFQTPIIWTYKNKPLPVESILTEPIQVYKDPPVKTVKNQDLVAEEQVYVIDANTRAPTLYVRPVKPEISLQDLLEHSVREAGALLNGHLEYNDRHYSYFLDLPALFASLKNQIMDWISNQIQYVDELRQQKTEFWNAYIYNPDNSLQWVQSFLSSLKQSINGRFLTWEQLKAPKPPADAESNEAERCLVILPALASGETVRLCIEYASRGNPKSILVLIIATRTDPYHLAFLTSIHRYRDSEIRMAFFMDFPIEAFRIGEDKCPMCLEGFELNRVKSVVESIKGKEHSLSNALSEKLSANKAIPLGSDHEQWLLPSQLDSDYDRAYLRALYEYSAFDIGARRELNALLDKNLELIDRFLEVISAERLNNQFSKRELSKRLFKVEPKIYQRLNDLIFNASPPFRIGDIMGAIVFLSPHVFITQAVNLIRRFGNSRRDAEEICLAILLIGIKPSYVAEFINESEFPIDVEIKTMFLDAEDVLNRNKESNNQRFQDSILAVKKLWAQLVRSTQFHVPLSELAEKEFTNNNSWESIQTKIEEVWRAWRGDIAELVVRIESSPLWNQLTRRHQNLGRYFAVLDQKIASLGQLGKKTPIQLEDSIVRGEVCSYAKEIENTCTDIANRIYNFFANPVLCSATQISQGLDTVDGYPLNVKVDVNQYVANVFCHLADLDYMCAEIIGNWRKHNINKKENGEVSFKLFQERNDIVLEFTDNFGGTFDLKSSGGLGVISQLCRAYGGNIEEKYYNDYKTLQLRLHAVYIMPPPNITGSEIVID